MKRGPESDPADADVGADDIDLSDLRKDLGFQVHLTRRAIWHHFRLTRQRDIPREPSGYFATLILIGANPGVAQGDITDALFLDPPNLAIILGKLAERGLMVRQADPVDRRRNLLSLTPAGEETYRRALEVSRATTKVISQDLTAQETQLLTDLLGKLQRSLKTRAGAG
jgi:DNA-binding MarR family transcriptional regulator